MAGFNHVIRRAIPYNFAPDLTCRVIPPDVLVLLKMIAFLDVTHRHEKDLLDIRHIFHSYAADTDREFWDEVFAANLLDASLAPAFLLGADLCSICSPDELALIEKFAATVSRLESWEFEAFRRTARFVEEGVKPNLSHSALPSNRQGT